MVTVACIPFLLAGGVARLKVVTLSANNKAFGESEVFASNSIRNIQTVLSIGATRQFAAKYSDLLLKPERETVRFAPFRGIMLAASMGAVFSCFALNLWYVAVNIDKDWCSVANGMTALLCTIFGGIRSGVFLGEAPDSKAAKKAAARIYNVLHSTTRATIMGGTDSQSAMKGGIKFLNVSFNYPSRTDDLVMDSFSLSINPGELVAIVGRSHFLAFVFGSLLPLVAHNAILHAAVLYAW